ncbi:glycosyltransferase family 4 protein [Streptomyces chumphonensis]|uniref:glycosyltransferase family 4 protein n=1 Tax=Streptomyces chumphonensis TaxID=1214925 RepID=UPI003D703FD9
MPYHDRPPHQLTVVHIAQPVDGGVARVVTDLVRAQCEEGLGVHLLCPPDGPLAGAARSAGAAVHPWSAHRAPGPALPAETARLARTLRPLRPDVVHAHSAKAGLAARLALRGRVPTVFQPHAWSFDAVHGTAARLARTWERAAARWTAATVCVSDDERRRGTEAGITAPWHVVPNGVDLDHFRPAADTDRHAARAALPALDGVPPGAPLLVCVARLCRQKGQDVLLRAWPAVREHCPDARLVLVGDGPERDRLLHAAPGRVVLAGAAADPRPWYRAADLVVLPSRWEGMALAPLEAMAAGRPVVLTDVTGARESLPPALHGPCLVPPEDPSALSRALTRLLTDPRRRSAAAACALQHVRNHHDVRRTAAAVAELYRDVLRGPHEQSAQRVER